jgi:hypothetical protein
MPDPKRKKVRTQVCKTSKSGETKCKYKMVKRTPKQLKAYDEMKSRGSKKRLSDLDINYPVKVIDKRKK